VRETTEVDVAVVGAGGGGYPAAFLLDRAGRRVAMVDPIGNLGGDCLAEGCVPSKAVREASVVRARAARQSLFGLRGEAPEVDWPGVLAHKDRVQRLRYDQHAEELRASGICFHAGRARVVGERELLVEDASGEHRYRFAHLILATGSAPSRLPVPGAELALTSHDLFRLGSDVAFPERPVIVGGGYIGVEVASMLENLGSSPTVLEATPELLPGFDAELAAALRAALGRRVAIRTGAVVEAIEKDGTAYRVRYRRADRPAPGDRRRPPAASRPGAGSDDDVEEAVGDAVVMATGRRPVLPEGVEHLGLEPGRPPAVDRTLRTTNPAVYAPGDVNGRSMLFHSAVRQSLVAAHAVLAGGQPVDQMDFTSEPEAASVGLTEAAARERGLEVAVTRYDYAVDARAQIFDEREGFLKLVWDEPTGRLLGAQVLGLDAAQLAAPLAQAVHSGQRADELAEVAYPHPMVSEGINKAARAYRP
jgi:dihydrolipoamide dehydrogenase